jgi:hypothetical protein
MNRIHDELVQSGCQSSFGWLDCQVHWVLCEGDRVSMFGARWLVGGGALLVAILALCVLLSGGNDRDPQVARELRSPALDDIDEGSRSAMRDLLRKADSEE